MAAEAAGRQRLGVVVLHESELNPTLHLHGVVRVALFARCIEGGKIGLVKRLVFVQQRNEPRICKKLGEARQKPHSLRRRDRSSNCSAYWW